ncbi:hypothetical protein IIA79_05710, partial [bacterium]|nr:hypothetical protein [bacterium]
LVEFWLDGRDSFSASPGAVDEGLGKRLAAQEGAIAWAIYEIPDIGVGDDLKALYVEASSPEFSGDHPGFWAGLANYEKNRWHIMSLARVLPLKLLLPPTAPYRSLDGSVYAFVLVDGGQAVTVDRVGMLIEQREGWFEVTLDSGPDAGRSSAIAFSNYSQPVVVWADHFSKRPEHALGNPLLDLADPANWELSVIDKQPLGTATWLDLVIDPVSSYPRVSMVYAGISGEDSKIGLSVYVQTGTNPIWLNYRLHGEEASFIDGAEYTSVDIQPGSGAYGVAVHARNNNSPAKPAYDMVYKVFQLDDEQVITTSNFGTNWLFPHLRYRPDGGNATAAVNGGFMRYEDIDNPADVWLQIHGSDQDAEYSTLGSIAYAPVGAATETLMGSSFAKIPAGGSSQEMIYTGFKDSLQGIEQVVDSVSSAGGRWIGAASQLAFFPDGAPAIAYTQSDGAAVYVKYARWDGAAWQIDDVSSDPNTLDDNNPVLLDLAIDQETGMAAISYNHLEGALSSLRVAIHR